MVSRTNDEVYTLIAGCDLSVISRLSEILDIPFNDLSKEDVLLQEAVVELNKFASDQRNILVIAYSPPWRIFDEFLAGKVQTELSLPEIGLLAKKHLEHWKVISQSLLKLYRNHPKNCLLVNISRPLNIRLLSGAIGKVGKAINERFSDEVFRPVDLNDNEQKMLRQVQAILSPDLLELYAELESCANLLGCEPDFAIQGNIPDDFFALCILNLKRQLVNSHVRLNEQQILVHQLTQERDNLVINISGLEKEKIALIEHNRLLETELGILRSDAESFPLKLYQVQEKLEDQQKALNGFIINISGLEKEKIALIEHNRLLETELDILRSDAESFPLKLYQAQEKLQGVKLRLEEQQNYSEFLAQTNKELKHSINLLQQNPLYRLSTFMKNCVWKFRTISSLFLNWKCLTKLRQMRVIRASGLFDEQWYLSQYPDVVEGNIAPIMHYLLIGAGEGRDPSPSFHTSWYLQTNQDVRHENFNPLVHYIMYGIKEGRRPIPLLTSK